MQGHVRKRHKPDCAKRKQTDRALRRQTRCTCDGSWQGRYRRDAGLPGETAWVEKTFRTKQEAQDWLTGQQAAIMQGEWIDPRKAERPFHELATAWQES